MSPPVAMPKMSDLSAHMLRFLREVIALCNTFTESLHRAHHAFPEPPVPHGVGQG